ncbi:MAG: acetamidase, partial [Proteobacteria bacterium]|nr:acetamidase [Pseudomonadota bacterium]
KRAEYVAKLWGMAALEKAAPVSIIGTGPNLNAATDNGLARAAKLFGMTLPEVLNRATITGAIEIGRHPGVVQVTFRVPLDRLARLGLTSFIKDQYGID